MERDELRYEAQQRVKDRAEEQSVFEGKLKMLRRRASQEDVNHPPRNEDLMSISPTMEDAGNLCKASGHFNLFQEEEEEERKRQSEHAKRLMYQRRNNELANVNPRALISEFDEVSKNKPWYMKPPEQRMLEMASWNKAGADQSEHQALPDKSVHAGFVRGGDRQTNNDMGRTHGSGSSQRKARKRERKMKKKPTKRRRSSSGSSSSSSDDDVSALQALLKERERKSRSVKDRKRKDRKTKKSSKRKRSSSSSADVNVLQALRGERQEREQLERKHALSLLKELNR